MAKILALVAVAYALSPIDLNPDFIPVVGFLDDLIILPLLISLALKLIPKEIMDECRGEAKDMWKDGKPKRRIYALPAIAIYLLVIFVAAKTVFFRRH